MSLVKRVAELFRWRPPIDHTMVRVFGPAGFADKAPEPPGSGTYGSDRKVSLIATVKQEANQLSDWLDGLRGQTRRPDQIVIVDGGSTDGTYEKLLEFAAAYPGPVHVLSKPGVNIAAGRNLAIRHAESPIIACTDAGCTLPRTWLAELVRPFEVDTDTEVVAGYYKVPSDGDLGRVLGLFFAPPAERVQPSSFLPSTRSVAFLKTAWAKAGGFPEWLAFAGEDTLFALALKSTTKRWAFVPNAMVWWSPEQSFSGLFRQVRRYAEGAGEAGVYPREYLFQGVRLFGGLGIAALLLAISFYSALQFSPWLLPLGVAASILLALRVVRPGVPVDSSVSGLRRAKMFALCVFILLTIRAACVIGFTRGVLKVKALDRSVGPSRGEAG